MSLWFSASTDFLAMPRSAQRMSRRIIWGKRIACWEAR